MVKITNKSPDPEPQVNNQPPDNPEIDQQATINNITITNVTNNITYMQTKS